MGRLVRPEGNREEWCGRRSTRSVFEEVGAAKGRDQDASFVNNGNL